MIQGSKHSTLLYIIYTNEIPRLSKLMENEAWYDKNLKEPVGIYIEVEHDTITYIDDRNRIVDYDRLWQIFPDTEAQDKSREDERLFASRNHRKQKTVDV